MPSGKLEIITILAIETLSTSTANNVSHYILDQYNLKGDNSYKGEFQVQDLLDRLRRRTKNGSVFSS